MANRTDRVYLNQQSILVTVFFHGNHVQEVAALLAFRPKTVLGAAKECYLTGFYRLVVCFPVHKTQHQHLGRISILYNCRNESVHFIKVQHLFKL